MLVAQVAIHFQHFQGKCLSVEMKESTAKTAVAFFNVSADDGEIVFPEPSRGIGPQLSIVNRNSQTLRCRRL